MKSTRHAKILELIKEHEIETQEELSEYLRKAGYQVTQATVSRDIRELKLTKVSYEHGKQRYTATTGNADPDMIEKYVRVFKEDYRSMDVAQNILVVKTVSGMAMAVAAALDHMDCDEIVGSIAGDDTIMCAVRSTEDAGKLMGRLKKLVGK